MPPSKKNKIYSVRVKAVNSELKIRKLNLVRVYKAYKDVASLIASEVIWIRLFNS